MGPEECGGARFILTPFLSVLCPLTRSRGTHTHIYRDYNAFKKHFNNNLLIKKNGKQKKAKFQHQLKLNNESKLQQPFALKLDINRSNQFINMSIAITLGKLGILLLDVRYNFLKLYQRGKICISIIYYPTSDYTRNIFFP